MKIHILRIVVIAFFLASCQAQNKKESHQFTNELIHETSPYLLQHAHNPVDWKPWNATTLAQAKKENKLIIISIGYSACHWCHVMEEESFENDSVAKIMNADFISIKVDREERPDVDKVYMKALQLMTGKGGWPLNIVALPDGRPIWGGTYFRKDSWQKALGQISKKFKNSPDEFYAFADKLAEGIREVSLVSVPKETSEFNHQFIEKSIQNWKNNFDSTYGGTSRVPKFMMPNNYHFLLRYAFQNKDEQIRNHVEKTLVKMAYGGVYDQLEGGFSRYSTDKKWHIPHFEKMLYDNAQLVSLYTDAYTQTKNELFKEVVLETLQFVKNELTSSEGAFYASLDADSYTKDNELEEGAYYSWTKEELALVLEDDYKLFAKYYNVNDYGHWEKNQYVLIKNTDDDTFAKNNAISNTELQTLKNRWKEKLAKVKNNRKKPRLDDKSLTSWNGLMLKGYLDAYAVFNTSEYLEIALKNANFIVKHQLSENGRLFHNYKNGKSTVNGHLDDYANITAAFIKLYQVTSDEKWLYKANLITEYAIQNFYDETTKLFYFTSKEDASLITRSIEYVDNVIPSSNSVFAKNLFLLSHYVAKKEYNKMAIAMLNTVKQEITNYPSSYANWLDLMMNYTQPFYEVVIVGKDSKEKIKELYKNYHPNILIAYSEKEQKSPLLEHRFVEGQTFIYVCVDNACKLPVTTIKETLELLK